MTRLSRLAALLLALVACGVSLGNPERPTEPFALRAVRAPGPAGDPGLEEHLRHSARLGFNAVVFRGVDAGSWSATEEPSSRPALAPAFRDLLRLCHDLELRPLIEIEPVDEAGGTLVFADRRPRRRLLKFIRLLRREGVRDWIVSFRGAPLRLTELRDLLEYGRLAAPAHVRFVRDLESQIPNRESLWFQPAIASDEQLNSRTVQYSTALLRTLPELPRRVGIVWNGPRTWSPSIDAVGLRQTRVRLGERPLLLEDRFPEAGRSAAPALAVNLGPLRQRDPSIAEVVAGYVACPDRERATSRLTLHTTAAFLSGPEQYDADRAWERAIDELAGPSPEVRRALTHQAMEWGGWIGTRNYRTRRQESPAQAALRLGDPAAAAGWTWIRRRYPERIEQLSAARDLPFRDALLTVMRRRLAVARCVPLVRELRARHAAKRADLEDLLKGIRRERARWSERPEVAVALDLFLEAAGIGVGADRRGRAKPINPRR